MIGVTVPSVADRYRMLRTRLAMCGAYAPGLLLLLVIAAAATYASEQLPVFPTMLVALATGMLFSPVAKEPRFADGIQISQRTVLRLGVALLGVRVSLAEIASLGWQVPCAVIAAMGFSLIFGYRVGRSSGLDSQTSIMAAGGVAICGASAILAISAAIGDRRSEGQRAAIIAAVTVAGTIAMLLYPLLGTAVGLSSYANAIFLGGSIHEVAQVVAATSLLPVSVATIAIGVKLLRVACLAPVVVGIQVAQGTEVGDTRPPILPTFIIAFIALAALSGLGLVPAEWTDGLGIISRWSLLLAMAAVGTQVAPRQLGRASAGIIAVVLLETVILAGILLVLLKVLPGVQGH